MVLISNDLREVDGTREKKKNCHAIDAAALQSLSAGCFLDESRVF